MASLYAQYLHERTEDDIIETDMGFVTFRYINEGKSAYIIDIFVLPEFRRRGAMKDLADKVVKEAKTLGCTELIGTVVPSTKGSTISLKALLGYGMSLLSSANNVIIFRKDI